jgi:hypothetical protein
MSKPPRVRVRGLLLAAAKITAALAAIAVVEITILLVLASWGRFSGLSAAQARDAVQRAVSQAPGSTRDDTGAVYADYRIVRCTKESRLWFACALTATRHDATGATRTPPFTAEYLCVDADCSRQ